MASIKIHFDSEDNQINLLLLLFSWKLVDAKLQILLKGGFQVYHTKSSQDSEKSQEEFLGNELGHIYLDSTSIICWRFFLFSLSLLLFWLFCIILLSISFFILLPIYFFVLQMFLNLIFLKILILISVFQTSTIHLLLCLKSHVQQLILGF